MSNRRTHTLTKKQRDEMIKRYINGDKSSDLAVLYDVHPAYVRVAAQREGYYRRKVSAAPSGLVSRGSTPKRRKGLIKAAGC